MAALSPEQTSVAKRKPRRAWPWTGGRNKYAGALYGCRVIFPQRSARGFKRAWPPDGHALRGAFGLSRAQLAQRNQYLLRPHNGHHP